MQRRALLGGLAGILAAGFAPATIGSGVLMPVRRLASPLWIGIDLAGGPDMASVAAHPGPVHQLGSFFYYEMDTRGLIWRPATAQEAARCISKFEDLDRFTGEPLDVLEIQCR